MILDLGKNGKKSVFEEDNELQASIQEITLDELTWSPVSSMQGVVLAQSGIIEIAGAGVLSDAGVQLALAPVAGTTASAGSTTVAAASAASSSAAFPSALLNTVAGLGVAGLAGAAGGGSGKSDKVAPGAPNIVRADDNVAPSLESVPNNGTTNDQTPSLLSMSRTKVHWPF